MTRNHQLAVDSLVVRYGTRTVLDGLTLEIPPGRVTVIVGANACGKSTLLRTMARSLSAAGGSVQLDGREVAGYRPKQFARILGLLPQTPIAPDGIVVADLVARGRYPHQGLLGRSSATDDTAVADALEATETIGIADRPLDELSGGQRQRVWIAMALAQQTDVLMLDEPTTFLDLSHQVEVLDLITDLNRRRGTTVVMVLHDLNLAARYADHLIALTAGRVHAVGTPAEVVTEEMMLEVFGLSSRVIPDPVTGKPLVVPIGRHHVTEEAGQRVE